MADKIYTPKPTKGDIEKELDKLSNQEDKAILKAKELAKIKLAKVIKDDVEADIITNHEKNGRLVLIINGKKLGVDAQVNNPVIIVNPPYKVFNGTYSQEMIDGELIDVPNVEENPEQALKELVKQVVDSAAKKVNK